MNHLDKIRSEIDRGALFVVNHSGGKDSQAMTALLRDVLPADRTIVVHAELPEADWEGLREHIESTVPAEWPVRYIQAIDKAGKPITFFDMVERRHQKDTTRPCWPGPKVRECTALLKRDPIAKVVRHELNARGLKRAVQIIGIRAEESPDREKMDDWKRRDRECTKSDKRTVHEWLPIHDLTESEVRQVVADAGQELHPAYAAGMSRLSCCFCIMASKSDLRTAARLKPELAQRYIDLEERYGFTMNMARKPLREIIAEVADESIAA